MKSASLNRKTCLIVVSMIAMAAVISCHSDKTRPLLENIGISKTHEGWYLVDTGYKCLAAAGCEGNGKHYDRGAVLEVPKCGDFLSPDNINGFVCSSDSIWRCDAESCDCMGQKIVTGIACTQNGPYICPRFVNGAECRDGNLYCGNEIAPQNVELYECSIDRYWVCQANECACGDETAYKGDYCIQQKIFDVCEDGPRGTRGYELCEGDAKNDVCLQREFYKDGFGDFKAYGFTTGYSGCGTGTFDVCIKPEGCYRKKAHYSFLHSERYFDYPYSYHYDRFEDFMENCGYTGREGVCVLDDVENDRNHATVPVVDAESGSAMGHGDTDGWHRYSSDSWGGWREVSLEPLDDAKKELKACGVAFDDVQDVLVYDNQKCFGGTIWCRNEKTPSRKPVDGNGYECVKFEPQEDATIDKDYDYTWVCSSEQGCQCGGKACLMGNACIDEQCYSPQTPASCSGHGNMVDGQCLCNGKERPSQSEYRCVSGQWKCDEEQCACGEEICPVTLECDNGRCLCGGKEVHGDGFKCEEGKWACHRYGGCRVDDVVCPESSYYENGRCYCGDSGPLPDATPKAYRCNSRWVCQKGSCACGNSTCPIDGVCDNGKCVCGKNDDLCPKVQEGYICEDVYDPYYDSSSTGLETWRCEAEEGCLCGGKICGKGGACIDEKCSCFSPIVSEGQSHYLPMPEDNAGYACEVIALPHDGSGLREYDFSTFSWVCKNEKGCKCGSETCPLNAQCVDGACECDGNKLKPGYICSDYEPIIVDDRYETNGTQICAQDQCSCGENTCPRGALCIDDKCYCGNIDYSNSNMSQYTCEPKDINNPNHEDRFWTCHDPNGCTCGNDKCQGNALCIDGRCMCGDIPNPGSEFICVTEKYSSNWICNQDDGCMNKGELTPKGTAFEPCGDGKTTRKDGCYCGDIKVNDPKFGCCNGHVYEHGSVFCHEDYDAPLVSVTDVETCGTEPCPPYSACIDGKCQNPLNGNPITREGEYLVDGQSRFCAEEKCTCGENQCKNGELCLLGICFDVSDYGSTRYDGRPVYFSALELHELNYTKMELSKQKLDVKTLSAQSYMIFYTYHYSYSIDKHNYSIPVCVNPEGCVCGNHTCVPGSVCNTENGECIYTQFYTQVACGATKDKKADSDVKPVITVDDNGLCACHGTIRLPYVAGYQCTDLGWQCEASEGCACGKATCQKDGICVKPGVCAE